MNRLGVRLFFLSFFLTAPGYLIAQPELKDSTEAYHYWARKAIIEMTYAHMQDYIETMEGENRDAEKEGAQKYYHDFIRNNEKIDFVRDTTILNEATLFLKANSWAETNRILFQPLLQKYLSSEKIDESFFDVRKPGTNIPSTVIPKKLNREKNWTREKNRIIKEYTASLREITEKKIAAADVKPKEPTRDYSGEIPKNSKEGGRNPKLNSDKDIIQEVGKYSIVFILAFLAGGLVMYLISSSAINRILFREKTEYLKRMKEEGGKHFFPYIGLVAMLRESKEKHKTSGQTGTVDFRYLGTIRGLETDLGNLRNENKSLQLQLRDLKKSIELGSIESKKPEITETLPLNRSLFYKIPETDGSFKHSMGSSQNDGSCLFRIDYTEKAQNASVYFIPGEFDRKAINNIDFYLLPACEVENFAGIGSASKIEIIRPGTATLLNGSWVMDPENKVKIRLL